MRFAQALIKSHKSIGGQGLRLVGLRDEFGGESSCVEESLRSEVRLVTLVF